MPAGKETTQGFTHVRCRVTNRDRAKEVARQLAAKRSTDVPYTFLIDDILNKGLRKYERQLGIVTKN